MIAGMVLDYNDVTDSGMALIGFYKYSFTYEQGQNMQIEGEDSAPTFTGRHEQPDDSVLKKPEKGDALLIQLDSDNKVTQWGYMNHYKFLLDHRYPRLVPFA